MFIFITGPKNAPRYVSTNAQFDSMHRFCHIFMDDCSTRIGARFGSMLFQRQFVSEGPPEIEGYTINKEECNINGDNVLASRFSMGGGGHSLEACHEECTSHSDCNFFNWAGSGFCHMYATCSDRRNLRHYSLSYSKTAAPLLLGSASLESQTSTSTAVLVFAVGALLGAVALVSYHYVKNKSTREYVSVDDSTETTYGASSRLLTARDDERV